jgi:hypothetical protein
MRLSNYSSPFPHSTPPNSGFWEYRVSWGINPEMRYETQRIDHLGIVAGICQEIGLIEEIDRQVGPGEQKVSVGQGTQAMELNAMGFSSRALYLMPDYMHNKPVEVSPDIQLNPWITIYAIQKLISWRGNSTGYKTHNRN